MARPEPRTLEVIAREQLTPNMIRITLGGPGMEGFPEGQQGGYVKLRLSEGGEGQKPIVRTYTIREQRGSGADAQIVLDFVVHGAGEGASHGVAGPAVTWAMEVAPGDAITVAGPGPAKPLPEGFDRYLVAGDMTALPAISVNLENLPADAHGTVLIEIQDPDDAQDLIRPEGVDIIWLVNPEPGNRPDLLAAELRDAGWEEGTYGWAASEFSAMRNMRDYLRGECGMDAQSLYISSYWKLGDNEDSHKAVKRADMEAAG